MAPQGIEEAMEPIGGLPAHIRTRRALVCALDWGLGHVARTTPLVRELLPRGSTVVLASNGRSADWWRREFPDLELRELPDYAVRYAPGPWLVPSLLFSLGRVRRAIRTESALLESWRGEGFDIVLSDNRYGCSMREVPSVLLTHQLRLAAPAGLRWTESFGERMMARLVKSFSEIWIPDRALGQILSGRLGHPSSPGRFPPLRYIGPLSRFSTATPDPLWSGPWDTVGMVSGPEPTRTDFENALRDLLARRPGRHLLVRGRPDLEPVSAPASGNVVEVPHLGSPQLAAALRGATEIVCRGGYSTVMDLDALGLLGPRCLFVPTPGQTEQETIASDLAAQGLARIRRQRDLPSLD
jgi:hypothetical protein